MRNNTERSVRTASSSKTAIKGACPDGVELYLDEEKEEEEEDATTAFLTSVGLS